MVVVMVVVDNDSAFLQERIERMVVLVIVGQNHYDHTDTTMFDCIGTIVDWVVLFPRVTYYEYCRRHHHQHHRRHHHDYVPPRVETADECLSF